MSRNNGLLLALASTLLLAGCADYLNRYDSVLDRLIDECQRERSGRWYRRMVAATCVVAGSAVIALCAYLFNFVAALD